MMKMKMKKLEALVAWPVGLDLTARGSGQKDL